MIKNKNRVGTWQRTLIRHWPFLVIGASLILLALSHHEEIRAIIFLISGDIHPMD